MTPPNWILREADEAAVQRLAQLIALKLLPGDMIALHGDLGAGKSAFARALVRALLGEPGAEVPSPTFSIVQTYETPRLTLAHLDLYRLNSEDEIRELGIHDLLADGAIAVEWPERAPSLTAPNRLDIALSESAQDTHRTVSLTATGSWQFRLARLAVMRDFLDRSDDWRGATLSYLQGDASARAYARLDVEGHKAILMDSPRAPDGPPVRDGLPYSRIAHLAEDVRPFVAIASALAAAGLSAPQIFAADLENGLLILEDFGDRVFGHELESGADHHDLWKHGVDTLLALRQVPVPIRLPLPDGSSYAIPDQDRRALAIETELLPDWYWPTFKTGTIPENVRSDFTIIWDKIFDRLLKMPKGWVLRDYHSPNLILLPNRKGAARTGIIDFQDALQGPAAYDLVSLLQDARVTVSADIETSLLAHYMSEAAAHDRSFDSTEFSFAYAALGAQRNTKILGIFARLAKRDNKPGYLKHIPRLWSYLDRCLAHPDLADLKRWFETHFPSDQRVPAQTVTTAMVLAAGLGKRMRPLTDSIPKPLVPLAGKPLLDHALDRLQTAGISKAVVNVHYLADQIEAHLAQRKSPPSITISDERGVLLETGGGIVKALPLLGTTPFLIHNSDTVWIEPGRSNIQRLIESWNGAAMDSLLLLAPRATSLGYDGNGDFNLLPDGQLQRVRKGETASYVFAGVSIAAPSLFVDAPAGRFSLNALWDRAIADGRLHGLVLDGTWMHVGTAEALADAEALIADQSLSGESYLV